MGSERRPERGQRWPGFRGIEVKAAFGEGRRAKGGGRRAAGGAGWGHGGARAAVGDPSGGRRKRERKPSAGDLAEGEGKWKGNPAVIPRVRFSAY